TKNNEGRLQLNSIVGVSFRTDGRVGVVSIYDGEIPVPPKDTTQVKQDISRYLITVANEDDYNLQFDGYRTSMDNALNLNTNFSQGQHVFPFSIDASRWDNLGGFVVSLDTMFYTLDASYTISQIEAAVNA